MRRSHVFLFDGTGRDVGECLTNVGKLYLVLSELSEQDGSPWKVNYYPGVSVGRGLLALYGQGVGLGLRDILVEAYKDLCSDYLPGDSISVFGFSRGAFIARLLVGLIRTIGILDGRYIISSNDEETLDRLINEGIGIFRGAGREDSNPDNVAALKYRVAVAHSFPYAGPAVLPDLVERVNGYNGADIIGFINDQYEEILAHEGMQQWLEESLIERYPPVYGEEVIGWLGSGRLVLRLSDIAHDDSRVVTFLGCWDTVTTMGLTGAYLFSGFAPPIFVRQFYDFHDDKLSKIVRFAYHALAVDDRRCAFSPRLWEPYAGREEFSKQKWFSGTHSDVGGGESNPPSSIRNGLFFWMLRKYVARISGLIVPPGPHLPAVGSEAYPHSQGYDLHAEVESLSVIDRVRAGSFKRRTFFWRDGESIHRSARERFVGVRSSFGRAVDVLEDATSSDEETGVVAPYRAPIVGEPG